MRLVTVVFAAAYPLLALATIFITWEYLHIWVPAVILGVTVQFWRRKHVKLGVLPTVVTGDAKSETMFFIHGWPDTGAMWDAQVAHFSERGFRCVTITLPNFGGRDESDGACAWGYDFDDLAALCGRTLAASLVEVGQESATIVIHDWGCHVGFMMQRLYPTRVKRVVAMDVGRPSFQPQSFSLLPVLIIAGLGYQYWLVTAFLLDRLIPLVGRFIGDAMTRLAVYCMGDQEQVAEIPRCTASMNYPYFYFHLGWLLEAHFIRKGFDKRHTYQGAAEDLEARKPTLFLYGADKGFKFHSEAFEKQLLADPASHVVPLPLPRALQNLRLPAELKIPAGTKPRLVGHWLMLRDAATVNHEMEDWLSAPPRPMPEGEVSPSAAPAAAGWADSVDEAMSGALHMLGKEGYGKEEPAGPAAKMMGRTAASIAEFGAPLKTTPEPIST